MDVIRCRNVNPAGLPSLNLVAVGSSFAEHSFACHGETSATVDTSAG